MIYTKWRHWRCVLTRDSKLWTTSVRFLTITAYSLFYVMIKRILLSQMLVIKPWLSRSEKQYFCFKWLWCSLDYDWESYKYNTSVKSDEYLCFCRLVSQEYICPNLHSWKLTTVWSHLCGNTFICYIHKGTVLPKMKICYHLLKPCVTFFCGLQQEKFSRLLMQPFFSYNERGWGL